MKFKKITIDGLPAYETRLPKWILDANVENADVEIEDSKLTWNGGLL